MFPVAGTEPPIRRIVGVIRDNPGPLALATALAAAARFSQIATRDPSEKGLTLAAVIEVGLIVAAHALATLTACRAVISGGRPAGFRGLSALPPGRLGPFLGYAVVFNLWFLALAAILTRVAQTLLPGQPDLVVALATGAITAAAALVMYIQLGFLFPDVTMTGKTSLIFAMALGFASARRVTAALALPVVALLFPQAMLAAVLDDGPGMAHAAAGWPSLRETVLAVLVAGLGTAGAVACATAITGLYLDLIQRLPGGVWR